MFLKFYWFFFFWFCVLFCFVFDRVNSYKLKLVLEVSSFLLRCEYLIQKDELKIPNRQAHLDFLYYYDESAINIAIIVLFL